MRMVMEDQAGQLSRAAEIFSQARQLSLAEREAFVRMACEGDAGLQREIESLLTAHEAQGEFLANPTGGEAVTMSSKPLEGPGSVIDGYRLLQLIGEGGFGAVYLAEQREPVVRKVALKIIKLGMDTHRVIARFEAERQALAMMDHPNIAKVLGAGATAAGRPYFVMELVAGEPITVYCDKNGLSIDERLDLFAQVCHAVQHAHTKGIIHRDLKPSNVLVSMQDGKPFAKVIDFGIAKATSGGARLTDKTLFTEHRALIGTPEYMSPEQAEGSLDIDTRCDIYSLGVLLYELLTGAAPFDGRRLRSAAWDEMLRIIREEDPPKPSTRLSALSLSPIGRGARGEGESSLAAIATQRHIEPGKLTRLVRGDLDWIVMKCLEKNRARRYETANALAQDIERHLSHEPVTAGPPSRVYRIRKFVRRHRAGTAAAALVSVAILLGLGGTSWGILWALNERDRATNEAGRADREATEAMNRAKETQQVADFQAAMLRDIDVEAMGRGIRDRYREQVQAALERQYVGDGADRRPQTAEEIDDMLAAFDEVAHAAQTADVARRIMDEFVLTPASKALEEGFHDQPLVQAQLHMAIGQTYRDLGLYDLAEPHLRASLDIYEAHLGDGASGEVAASLYNLAHLMFAVAEFEEAETLERRALSMWQDLSNVEMIAMTMNSLAGTLVKRKRYAEAEPLLREALRLRLEMFGEDHPSVFDSRASLSAIFGETGRHAEAEALDREILQWRREHFGDVHPKVAHVLYNMGTELQLQGKFVEAEEAFREVLAIQRAVYGDEHPLVARTLSKLGYQLVNLNRPEEAETCFVQALAMQRALLGELHPDVRDTLRRLGRLRQRQGDQEGAVALFREGLASAQRAYPPGHPDSYELRLDEPTWKRAELPGGGGARDRSRARDRDLPRGRRLYVGGSPRVGRRSAQRHA